MRACLLAVIAFILPGCASRDLWPVERVDPDTAVHVTIMAEPWIYARAEPGQAVRAGEFLYVVVVEANRTGTRSYWLNVVSWRIGDSSRQSEWTTSDRPVEARLGWPTKQMRLAQPADSRSSVGLSEPAITVPGETSGEAWFPLSIAQVSELGADVPSALVLVDEAGSTRSYAAWRIEKAAITEFLKATGTTSN